MHIEARLNSVYVKEPCVACGEWDRAGDVAYFDENGARVCDRCVDGGVERIRVMLGRGAEYYHELARQYGDRAEEEITIAPVSEEVRRGLAEREALWKVSQEAELSF